MVAQRQYVDDTVLYPINCQSNLKTPGAYAGDSVFTKEDFFRFKSTYLTYKHAGNSHS